MHDTDLVAVCEMDRFYQRVSLITLTFKPYITLTFKPYIILKQIGMIYMALY